MMRPRASCPREASAIPIEGDLPAGRSLHETPAKSTLDAKVPVGDFVVQRRGGLDDLAILHVQRQRAANATIRADRIARGLFRFAPVAALPQLVLAAGHQCAGRTN